MLKRLLQLIGNVYKKTRNDFGEKNPKKSSRERMDFRRSESLQITTKNLENIPDVGKINELVIIIRCRNVY